jgi:hypothetical protein
MHRGPTQQVTLSFGQACFHDRGEFCLCFYAFSGQDSTYFEGKRDHVMAIPVRRGGYNFPSQSWNNNGSVKCTGNCTKVRMPEV